MMAKKGNNFRIGNLKRYQKACQTTSIDTITTQDYEAHQTKAHIDRGHL